MTVMLHADSPVVRCILDLDNGATDHRLRARLPVGSQTPAIVGTQFGYGPEAAPLPDTGLPLEAAPRTAPAHRYVAVFGASRGLAFFAPGFFEYERTPQGDVAITLLRAIGALSRNDLPGRPGHAAWPTPTPEAQCLGPTRIELAVASVAGPEALPELWESVFTPVRGVWIRDAIGLATPAGGVTLEGAGLVFSTLKPVSGAGEGMVLRCLNPSDRRAAGAWRFAEPVQSAHRTRLDEAEPVPLILEDHGHVVRFTVEPHELSTIVVR
jgi:alpha-mannosidase